MAFTPDYAPISHKPENLPGRKPQRRKKSKTVEGNRRALPTSKPVNNQDISGMTDPQGSNAKKPPKHGLTVGLRF
jgi:hypothetical protein